MDFGKQNCDISSSQKPIIWFPELLFKFISGFDMVLGLSELIVNFRGSGEALHVACEWRDQNC